MNELKMRRVIGTATMFQPPMCGSKRQLVYDETILEELLLHTKVDLVVDIPIERKLVQPEGAVWHNLFGELIPGIAHHLHILQLSSGKIVATACSTGYRTAQKMSIAGNSSLGKYQEEAEHALADAGLHGFGWEPAIDPVAWDVDWIDFKGMPRTTRVTSLHTTMGIYKQRVKQFTDVHLYAVGHDGKRCEVVVENETEK